MIRKDVEKTIEKAILNSNTAYVNQIGMMEAQELADVLTEAVWKLLEDHEESVEGLFNPDGDDGLMAVPLNIDYDE